jgi:hypothetical protein
VPAVSSNKQLLLIGASRGLGFALAEEYVKRGWHVVATERVRTTSQLHELFDRRIYTCDGTGCMERSLRSWSDDWPPPVFFCEVIAAVFRSEKDDKAQKGEPTELKTRIAQNAYSLLHGWRILPGATADGGLDGAKFTCWLNEVKVLSEESGHLRIALDQLGQALPYAPEDATGLVDPSSGGRRAVDFSSLCPIRHQLMSILLCAPRFT